MDIATVLGLLVGIGAVAIAFFLEGGALKSVFQLPAMILVIFGTIGAATVTTSLSTIKNIPSYLKIAFYSKMEQPFELINRLVGMAEKARREGILGLEDELKSDDTPFFRKAWQLVIDGTEVTILRSILETEVAYISERHSKGQSFFQKLGGFSPTLGIIGTVLGLINALGNTGDASSMASHIAAAFIATLWGISLANLLYLPISDKLRFRNEEEMKDLELIIEGVISIQSGENPRVIRTKLLSFVTPRDRRTKR
ncbi:MAG: motility protein A [candidate division Zixibacteria bacterium]